MVAGTRQPVGSMQTPPGDDRGWARWPFDLGYAAVLAALFGGVVFGGWAFISRDVVHYFYPAGETLADAWRGTGSFLWDPGVDHGVPFVGRWVSAVFYPFTWLVAFVSPAAMWAVAQIVHGQIAASAAFRLALRYTPHRTAAWIGGLGYACGGYYLSMLGFGTYAWGVALLPAGLLALHRLCEQPGPARAAVLAAVLALQIFAGDPQLLYFEAILCLPAVLLVRALDGGRFRAAVAWSAAAGVAAVAVAAAQIAPAIELGALSVRAAGFPVEEATRWSFHPLRLVEFAVPFAYGTTTPQVNWWLRAVADEPFTIPWAASVYVGLIPLAGLAAAGSVRRRDLALWGGIGAFYLAMAFGSHVFVYRLVSAVLPGADRFRYPEKLIPFVCLATAILGAAGLGKFLSDDATAARAARRRLVAMLAVVGVASAAVWGWCSSSSTSALAWFGSVIVAQRSFADAGAALADTAWALGRTASIALAAVVLILIAKRLSPRVAATLLALVAAVDIFTSGAPLIQVGGRGWLDRPPLLCEFLPHEPGLPPPVVWRELTLVAPPLSTDLPPGEIINQLRRWAVSTLAPNTGTPSCVRHAHGYEAGILGRHESLLNTLAGDRDRLFSIAGVQYLITRLGAPPGPPFREVFRDADLDVAVYGFPGVPYVRAAESVEFALDERDALRRLSAHGFDPRRRAVIESAPSVAAAGPGRRTVTVTSWRPGAVELSTAFDVPGYVVVLESFYPGWRATLDGDARRAAPVHPANAAFLGVEVPAGAHALGLVFDPPLQRAANRVSIGSGAVALIVLGGLWYRRRRGPPPS